MSKKRRHRQGKARGKGPQANPQTNRTRALELVRQQQWAAATPLLRSLLTRPEANDELRRALAQCLQAQEQYGECRQVLLALHTPQQHDLLLAGWCACREAQWEVAEQCFTQAQQFAESGWGYRGHALVLATGRHNRDIPRPEQERIIALLRRALSCADCPESAGQWLANMVFCTTAAGDRDQFLAVYDEILALHPDFMQVRYDQIGELLMHGESERAWTALQPLLGDPPPPRTAWLAFSVANERQDWAAALNFLECIPDPATEIGPAAIQGDLLRDTEFYAEAAERYGHEAERADASDEARLYGLAGRALARLALRDGPGARQDTIQFVTLWCALVEKMGETPYPGATILVADHPEAYYREAYTITDFLTAIWDSLSKAPAALSGAALAATELEFPAETRGWLCYMYYEYSGSEYNEDYAALVEAAALVDAPPVRYALMRCHAARGEWLEALEQYFAAAHQEVAARGDTTHYAFYEEDGWHLPAKLTRKVQQALHRCGQEELAAATPAESQVILLPFYQGFWRPLLCAAKMYAELGTVAEQLEGLIPGTDKESLADRRSLHWDRAYALHSRDLFAAAAELYRECLVAEPDNPNTLHNLSLVVAKLGDTAEAKRLADRAAQLAPRDELITKHSKALAQQEETRRRQEEQQEDFLRTARDRWPQLGRYPRQLVAALTVIHRFQGWDDLARLTGQEARYLPGHWRKLVDAGMIIESDGGKTFRVNPHISDLAELERTHSLVAQIVRADPTVRFKPVFNSKLEYTVYRLLATLFPNHLVCPNTSPLAIFNYDRMKEVLDAAEFQYFLMCLVDFVIINTTTYLPILAFEVDSQWHDGAVQQARDQKKNRIFQLGGVPLIRLRPYGQPSEQAMQQQIVAEVRALLAAAPAATGPVNLAAEVAVERFAALPLLPTAADASGATDD